jgi:hypothetical protein
MKLLIFTMPALALITMLSFNVQHSMGGSSTQTENESGPLPEARLIIETQINKANIQRRQHGLRPIVYTPVASQQLSSE